MGIGAGPMNNNKERLIAAMLGLALLGACAQQPPRNAGENVSVIVLPKGPEGKVGAVIVRPIDGGEPVLLNKAYVAARVTDSGAVRTVPVAPKQVQAEFGQVLSALPEASTSFTVYFIEGKDELNPEAKLTIDRLFTEYASRPSPEIEVIGHTDFLGADDYNDALLLQRVRWVRDLMVERGIPAKIIGVAGRGKREPLFPTQEGVAEPRNRRVEINIR